MLGNIKVTGGLNIESGQNDPKGNRRVKETRYLRFSGLGGSPLISFSKITTLSIQWFFATCVAGRERWLDRGRVTQNTSFSCMNNLARQVFLFVSKTFFVPTHARRSQQFWQKHYPSCGVPNYPSYLLCNKFHEADEVHCRYMRAGIHLHNQNSGVCKWCIRGI